VGDDEVQAQDDGDDENETTESSLEHGFPHE
jgi:hypothetical protein